MFCTNLYPEFYYVEKFETLSFFLIFFLSTALLILISKAISFKYIENYFFNYSNIKKYLIYFTNLIILTILSILLYNLNDSLNARTEDTAPFKSIYNFKNKLTSEQFNNNIKTPECSIEAFRTGLISWESLLTIQNDQTGTIDLFLYKSFNEGNSFVFKNNKIADEYLKTSLKKENKEARKVYLKDKINEITEESFNKLKKQYYEKELICILISKFYEQDEKDLANILAKENKCYDIYNENN